MPSKQPSGMFGFSIVWFGQLISLLGTNMTGFATTIWAYEKTGSATALALVGFFYVTPMLIFSPIAGAIVDRHDRKFMMMISDLASGVATVLILVLYLNGSLQIWHLYITGAFQGLFQTFQWPAYSAAITTMLSKQHYGRANGMMSLAESGSGIFAPLLAGAMLGLIGLASILVIDVITFIFAIGALLVVHIPNPPRSAEGRKVEGSLWQEAAFGFRYILARPSLLSLQCVFLLGNFFAGIAFAIMAPMILATTGNNELVFGSVNSAGAVGGVVGGLAMSAWGGPKRRVLGVLWGWVFAGLFGIVLLGIGRSLPVWAVTIFLGAFMTPVINGSNQAIWQSKIPPDLQGRVFSIRRLIAWFVNPLSMLIAGPLADFVFEPAMQPGRLLADLFGWLVGVGPGRGMALIYVITGLGTVLVGVGGLLFPLVRNVESILPDHDLASAGDRRQRMELLIQARQRLAGAPYTHGRGRALRRVSQELRELGRQRSQV